MPNATVSLEPSEKIYLESLEGAWVRLRPLPYGKILERRDKGTKMSMEQQQQARRGRRSRQQNEETQKINIDFYNQWSRQFDFENCIAEHNLEDSKGAQLDFTSPMTFTYLNPKVAMELERLIDDLNGEEDEEAIRDLASASSLSSSQDQRKPELVSTVEPSE